MKKILSIILLATSLVIFGACSNPTQVPSAPQVSSLPDMVSEPSLEAPPSSLPLIIETTPQEENEDEATYAIDPLTLFQNDDIKITASSITESVWWGTMLNISIENNTDEYICVRSISQTVNDRPILSDADVEHMGDMIEPGQRLDRPVMLTAIDPEVYGPLGKIDLEFEALLANNYLRLFTTGNITLETPNYTPEKP